MFPSVEDVQSQFRDARYIASRRISTVVYLAARMSRPILVEGPAGVGKTELAKTLSEMTRRKLVRLQCYEGLDEGKALYEWKYAKQLLYTQLLRERIGELIADAPSLPDAVAKIAGQDDAFFSHRFLSARPLLMAIEAATVGARRAAREDANRLCRGPARKPPAPPDRRRRRRRRKPRPTSP